MSPTSVNLGPASTLGLTKTQTVPLTITLPPSSLTSKVDIALLLDDTGSFKLFAGTVESLFSDLVSSLQAALPGVDLGFGVARFEDYGGPFSSVTTEKTGGRPFILDQPIVTAATATAAGTDLNTLMKNALAATGPGFQHGGRHSGSGHSRRCINLPPARGSTATATGPCSTADQPAT